MMYVIRVLHLMVFHGHESRTVLNLLRYFHKVALHDLRKFRLTPGLIFTLNIYFGTLSQFVFLIFRLPPRDILKDDLDEAGDNENTESELLEGALLLLLRVPDDDDLYLAYSLLTIS